MVYFEYIEQSKYKEKSGLDHSFFYIFIYPISTQYKNLHKAQKRKLKILPH